MGLPEVQNTKTSLMEAMIVRVARLPVQGSLLPKLQKMLGELDSNTDDVLGMIKLDPGLTGRILRRANSAALSAGTRIGSIEEAVARVGYYEVNRLLLESVTHRLLARPLRCYGLAPGALWQASLACAFAMEKLARHTHRSEDTAYTVGLLHSVGMIVISGEMESGQKGRPLLGNPFDPNLGERERERFGFDHAEIGAELLRFWDFPPSMIEAIRFQLMPTRCETVPKLACLLSLARWVRDHLSLAAGHNSLKVPDPYLIRLAGLDQDDLDNLVRVVKARLDDAEDLVIG